MYAKTAINVLLFTGLATAFGTTASGQSAPASDTAIQTRAVDNTRINQRDKAPAALKSTDQPNNTADVAIAADARRAIVDDKSLSVTAHNVKLVARDGVITLRGPVNSPDEKVKVGRIVASVRGVSSVDNQLDVKTQ